jgi:hypothetical protein
MIPPRHRSTPETTSMVMGDLHDPYGASEGFSPTVVAGGAGEVAEEDMWVG